ncbi:hypothetical protein [Flavobacterium tistrianum]|uniref:hypothetical protein n=1 Tax=Flavobacterium tistrianum TaxID=1685414 RepID=UPI000DAC0DF5|nr:hypothetical protein [Flavobacterium tistrianum]KAF2342392.1 hypothetical protein DMB71_04335 [Flavobacterium tistrianum]
MKNILILLFSIFALFIRCNKPIQPKKDQKNSKLAKSLTNSTPILKPKDTLAKKNNQTSPIKIIRATLHKNDYSQHKDISLIFKNTGQKSIKAIKLEWFCINSFEEPASGRSFYGEGRFTENSTHLLKPGQLRTEFWEDFSTDADKIIEIRAYHIVFTDGTKWELNKDFSHPLLKGLEKNKFERK